LNDQKIVATTATATHTEVNLDWGDIMWPAFGIVVAILVFVALKDRFFPKVSGRLGDKEIQIGEPQGEVADVSAYHGPERRTRTSCDDEELVLLTFRLTIRTTNVRREIEAAQGDLIDDEYANFRSYVRAVNFDQEALWRHVEDALASAVKNNHLLQVVNLPTQEVEPLYLMKKVTFVKRRYIELGVDWTVKLEQIVTTFFIALFVKFALEAEKRTQDLVDELDTHLLTSRNPAIAHLVAMLKEEIGATRKAHA